MPSLRLRHPARRLALVAAGLLVIVLATGCTTTAIAPATIEPEPEARTQTMPDGWVPVARYGRYTLVELAPEAAQHDLLLQVIDVSMPATLPATVGDALRYVLLRSGYRLCEHHAQARALYLFPLPAAHLHLGPLTLREALLTLAGPAWDLKIDDTARRVCFARRVDDGDLSPFDPVPAPAEPAATATPLSWPEVSP
ncbi:MAG: PilL N-terminal domain-containing protein [Rhodanobacter sp.]